MHFLAEEFHDIAPPVEYSLVPTWVVFVASVVGLALLAAALWYARQRFRRSLPVTTARERALAALDRAAAQVETVPPYQFSIRLSDVVRRYVLEQFNLPMTRQTSIEFLNSIASSEKFTEDDRTLLSDFLNRCDLIKFARYDATAKDSRLLLDKARQFVKGRALVHA